MFDGERNSSNIPPVLIMRDYFAQFEAVAKKNGFNTDYQLDTESGRVTAHALRLRGLFGSSGDIAAFVVSEAECARGLDNELEYNQGKPLAKDVLNCEGLKILYNPKYDKKICTLAKDLESMIGKIQPNYKVSIIQDSTF